MRKLAKEAGLKPKEDECVRVFVRVRPLSHKEKGNGNRKVVFCDADLHLSPLVLRVMWNGMMRRTSGIWYLRRTKFILYIPHVRLREKVRDDL